MTAYIGWTPPPGVAVVSPPVHVETEVDLIFSDRSELHGVRAGSQNWSAVGDGPRVVAYAVVQEYKLEAVLWEGWLNLYPDGSARAHLSPEGADKSATSHRIKCIHVREVPDPSREVVAWAVVKGDDFGLHYSEAVAESLARERGGTAVRLSGVMPS
jgi:hypothetical protein